MKTPTTKIYVAAHDQLLARAAAGLLRTAGYTIMSSWLDMSFLKTDQYSEEDRRRIAKLDADEVLQADCLVLLSGPDRYTGGKFIEAGIALGAGKRVYVIGRRENMLLWHPDIECFESVDALINRTRPRLAEDLGVPTL